MELLKVGDFYVWRGGYETKDIPKAARFRWNPDKKRWETKSLEIAMLLREYATGKLKDDLDNAYEDDIQKIAISSATDSDIEIPCPDGLSYFGYQKAGIAYALANKNVLIGDEMGLGKTIQVIGLINASPDLNRILIVCPASLKLNWYKELTKWLTRPMSIHILKPSDKKPVKSDILIVNYDLLTKYAWLQSKFDLLVADECHYLKNPKAQRTERFMAIREHADRLVLLTGTPILNRPIELWPFLQMLDFPMNFWEFVSRYCGATKDNGWDKSGATNMEELQVSLRRSVMVRRQKADVLGDLPPKTRQIIYLDPEKYQQYIDAEEMFLATHGKDSDGFDNDFNQSVNLLHDPSPVHISEMSRLRHNTAVAKIPDVIKHISELLETTDKVVIFAHHRDVVSAIYEAFSDKAVYLIGGMSATLKDDAVTQFQTNPKIKVFVGSIQAAGVGLTLTSASTVVFAELDWVPGNITQAEDRCHRIGQLDNVLVQHIVVDGSMDAMLAKKIVKKQDIIDRAMLKERAEQHLESQKAALKSVEATVMKNINEAKKTVVAKPKVQQKSNVSEIETQMRLLKMSISKYLGDMNQ